MSLSGWCPGPVTSELPASRKPIRGFLRRSVRRTRHGACEADAMRFPVDLSLFEGARHSPSLFELARSMHPRDGRSAVAEAETLRDHNIPVNAYFPTSPIFARLRARLEHALKLYPSSQREIARMLGSWVDLD